jgi:hypothetical protein
MKENKQLSAIKRIVNKWSETGMDSTVAMNEIIATFHEANRMRSHKQAAHTKPA